MRRVAGALVPGQVRRAIAAHARAEAPRECCGFLLGTRGRVAFALPVRNVARDPVRRFRVDPCEHLAVRRWVRRLSPPLEIVGVYHSHPAGAPVPSARDCAEARYPEWLYVIAGLQPRVRIAAYRLGRGGRDEFRRVG